MLRMMSLRRAVMALVCVAAAAAMLSGSSAQAQDPYPRQWGASYNTQDWNRFYHYPYVYYPQNYWDADYFKSADDMYYRYPPEMRVPVYNRAWHNEYPQPRRYHQGHHFILDVF